MRDRRFPLLVFFLGTVFSTGISLAADHPQPASGPFATPLTNALVDDAASAEYFDGVEHPLANANLLRQLVWTQTMAPLAPGMLSFGASTHPGPRYLRLGFKSPVAVGSILVRGGDQVSVLRPDAPYPGNLANDSQWIPAQRIVNGQVSTAEVDRDHFALWTLPSVVQTRAVRFTHTASLTDPNYAGIMGGAYILSSRFTNLAPQASVLTSANPGSAPLLIDEKQNNWATWDNGPDFSHPVTADHPEWIVLSWPKPVALRGLVALWSGFNAADAQIFTGPANAPLQGAPESDWQRVGQPYSLSNQFPVQLGPDWLDFGKVAETRAVRLRITQVTNESHDSHLAGKTNGGNRVWLGELMAIAPLNASDLKTEILPAAVMETATVNPPIPIHFNLTAPGSVSLVIDDAQGNRVRNLISDTQFPAGANTVWWDGTDDLGRNPDAAVHGVYFIPKHFVAPGHYQVHGIVHQQIDEHYEFPVYAPGNPPWDTPDGKGGWLTNHTPASSALFVPASKAPGGKPLVYLGCYVGEGGSVLAWFDLDGNKQGGRGDRKSVV